MKQVLARLNTLLILVILFFPYTVLAVPPPDLVIENNSNVYYLFYLVSGIASLLYIVGIWNLLSKYEFSLKHRKSIFFCAVIIGLAVLGFSYNAYENYRQKDQLEAWKKQTTEALVITTTPAPVLTPSITPTILPETNFFTQHQDLPLAISNADFKTTLANTPSVFILDAREDEEYENGHFPGSHHVRFADLKAGILSSLPRDEVVYVFCWSGIRGKEVTEYLRTQNIVARYIEKGAKGWVDEKGTWQGEILFLNVYKGERYTKVYTTKQVKDLQAEGVILVDSREPSHRQKKTIQSSIAVPVFYTPTSELETTLGKVTSGAKVITMCDDYVSCFDAKVTGVKLEKRGHEFLGRYASPWEY